MDAAAQAITPAESPATDCPHFSDAGGETICAGYLAPISDRLRYLAAAVGFLVFIVYSALTVQAAFPLRDLLFFYLNPLLWYGASRGLLSPVIYLHEFCHWIAFRGAGASPRIEKYYRDGVCRGMSVVAPGRWLTRNQFLSVILAPTFGVNGVGLALLALPLPAWLRAVIIATLSLHLTGCFGDWLAAASVLKLPRRTLIEDRDEGFAYRMSSP